MNMPCTFPLSDSTRDTPVVISTSRRSPRSTFLHWVNTTWFPAPPAMVIRLARVSKIALSPVTTCSFCVTRSLRVGGLGRCGPRLRRRRFGFGSRSGRLFHDQVHHHVAFEANHLAAVDDPKLVGGQRAVQQLDVDMFVRRHRALVDVDI